MEGAAQDWGRLGRAVAEARRALPDRPTQVAFARALGISRATVQAVERGTGFTRVTSTLRAVERGLGWRDGSVEAVLAGGAPAPRAAAAPAELAAGMPRRILHELSEGQVVDTSVLEFGPDGSGTRMIVVVKHAGDAEVDAERLRDDLAVWIEIERSMRAIAAERRPPPGGPAEPGAVS